MLEWIESTFKQPKKIRFNNMVIETTSEFSVRLMEIIWDMFFADTEVEEFWLDNIDISTLKKATLSKLFLILESELKEIVKSKQKLLEEVPKLYSIIYKFYRERAVMDEKNFRDYLSTHIKEHIWVDDLLKIIIDWFSLSLKM